MRLGTGWERGRADLDPVRIGFVGCGNQARDAWYPSIVRLEKEVHLVACCDIQAELAERTAKRFGADRWYTDVGEMIAKEDLEAVIVVGPPVVHAKVAPEVIRAGLALMMEKPMASTLAEAKELVLLAEEKGVVTQIGHNMRHAPLVHKVKELMSSPEFGKTLYVESVYHMPSPGWTQEDVPGWVTASAPKGWYHLIAQAVHGIDLARDIGGEIVKVHAVLSDPGAEARFVLAASVEFESGACGLLKITGASANWSTGLEVIGDGPATIRLTDLNHLVYEPAGPEAGYRPPYGVPAKTWTTPTRDNSERRAGYEGEIAAFARAVRAKKADRPTFRDAYQAMKIAHLILESLEKGHPVDVSTDL